MSATTRPGCINCETGEYEDNKAIPRNKATGEDDNSMHADKGSSVNKNTVNVFGLSGKEWIVIFAMLIMAGAVGYDAAVRSDAQRGETLLRNHVDHLSNQVEVETILVAKLTECKR